jgi:holliday junction DNA helicase RuvB
MPQKLETVLKHVEEIDNEVNKQLIKDYHRYLISRDTGTNYQKDNVKLKTMTSNRDQKLTIFATCNNKNKLASEMLSRFLKFHLKEYSLEEFNMIGTNIVTYRFNKTQEFAQKLVLAVWYKMNSKDIRDVIKVARLAKKEEDIDMIIEALQEYKDT